ncbi:MAG: DUF1320 domain-containing protein [Candidatus Cloacimonetes bacterium]|nr:DUF1320 domain-containing protein [Candidatus Cloacimonadota bacterium]
MATAAAMEIFMDMLRENSCMEYITEKDFLNRYPVYKNNELKAEIVVAIHDAKSLVDSYIQHKFRIQTPIPNILKRVCADLTCYYLQIRNLQATEEDNVNLLYKQSISILKQIQSGELCISFEDISEREVVFVSSAGDFEYRAFKGEKK